METAISPRKKLKSPGLDVPINPKASITCLNVPDDLFDANTAKKHFSKFGRVQRIRQFPKRQMCIIEYDQPPSAERAVLNAGAFDGFMFDVTRFKPRVRRRSKKDEDPDWVPDSDVEEELSAMSGGASYRITRKNPLDGQTYVKKSKESPKALSEPVVKKKINVKYHPSIKSKLTQPVSGIESPVPVQTAQTSLSTKEAATELHQLRFKISLTPDEQWRTLESRDRILRGWGGAGSRVKVGGATIGTCQDMCPERELLHRQAEHQVMTLETVPDSDCQLDPWRAVKQYSRSSADQEIPMCYELRPAPVLMRTCAYLLHEIADTKRQVSLADWFHFMWDRLRSIRKDITQQALCCAESIRLIEMCARFHAHCAARLADLEHTQFDQKLNTDNLTKCLQTLKHMYADVGPDQKPNEAEFRGYIALLNLGDSNFWWEIKQLPQDIQKSEPLIFATQVFNAIDNNHYVRFFRLVQQRATYLQASILLRYFNDVRARALARIVKAYAPRGGSKFPASDLINALAFESLESMKHFINHYGLRFAKSDDMEVTVILDRNQFIEDSDPYPTSRAISLIESKRKVTVGEVIAGGSLPNCDFENHVLFTSFIKDGKLKESALLAENQAYNTVNDSNKDIGELKHEISLLGQRERHDMKPGLSEQNHVFLKPESKTLIASKSLNTVFAPKSPPNQFSFKPAIPVAPTDIIKNSPEKTFDKDAKNVFSFSKPQESTNSLLLSSNTSNLFKPSDVFKQHSFGKSDTTNINNQELGKDDNKIFNQQELPKSEVNNIFKQKDLAKPIFPQFGQNKKEVNIFDKPIDTNVAKPGSSVKFSGGNNIFAKSTLGADTKSAKDIFGTFNKTISSEATQGNIFLKSSLKTNVGENATLPTNSNGDITNKFSPGSIFKQAIIQNGTDSIFKNKIKGPTTADSILDSVGDKGDIYNFNEKTLNQPQVLSYSEEIRLEEERKLQEKNKKDEEERIEALKRQEEQRRLEEEKRKQEERRKEEEKQRAEAKKKQEELKQLEEKRRKEREKREQEELERKRRLEREAELKRKAEEERIFRERVEKESSELVTQLVNEVSNDSVSTLMKDEREKFNTLMLYAEYITEEIASELNIEMTGNEMKGEKFRIDKLRRQCFNIWKEQARKNVKRRSLLENTPVWLTDCTPADNAIDLRRRVEMATLRNMNAVHKGYKFNGELKPSKAPKSYDLVEIIRSPLLKRMKQINYPYDKCFFWKVTLVSPGPMQWLYRKIEMDKWLLDAFSDKKRHDESECLINVGKQSWNHLMDFAVSVSLIRKNEMQKCNEAMEGTNGLIIYATENDLYLTHMVQEILKNKYPYQVIPIAIITAKKSVAEYSILESLLTNFQNNKIISAFKIYILEPQNISNLLSLATKTALKWLAKKCPQNPPVEIDYLKSICQRYLCNEIWCHLKSEVNNRKKIVIKDLKKLVQCYNIAVDKLTNVITNEDLFNYPSFPLEFKVYLNDKSPYPKPYEFLPSNAKNSENISAIKDIMIKLKLPSPISDFQPLSMSDMQQQIRKYCNQIGWFENPEEVVCKVVALLPNEYSDISMAHENLNTYFAGYDLIDILNIIVYEKINNLKNFDNRYAIYEKTVLDEYRNTDWLFNTNLLQNVKHKAIDYNDDDLDMMIEAKRRKIAMDSMEYLMLEDKDCTMVEENIKANDECISRYNTCSESVKQLEEQLENEKKKSLQLENLLKLALSDV